ncbi:HAD family hydrolase [Bacillus sp. V2I10]|uniref:HAD family hydrolase n=1 Tax=Bacillus sp. V2I10 TaxID=3042276 RepID=UPI0027818B2A|nr:HAD family hydrolase [Bacillus sp. V2I10]MDQ0859284.1 putative hydrolase of the HAD superfamily [Bacillus sp. V2I10]
MPIKAVVFDMDDTLYYESDYVRSGMHELEKWVMKNYSVNGFYGIAMNFFETGENKYIFNKTLDLLKIPYDEKIIQKMINVYRSHKPSILLLDDAKWVLNHIEKKVKVGLISDGFLEAQINKVQSLGLTQKFHSIILTDQFGRNHWKPSQRPYEQICINLQVSHDECMYIGDNVKKDFVTANKLGWKTVHVERENGVYSNITEKQEYMAHYKINNLKKISVIPEFQHLFITYDKEATYS